MAARSFMPIQLIEEDRRRVTRGERLIRVKQVPWSIFVDAHERQSQANHGQTLNRIAERGGFDATEMLAVLSCSKWQDLDNDYAHRLLYALIVAFNRGGLLGVQGEHPVHRLVVAA